LIDACVVVF
jgi:hypothetical protein